MVDYSKWEKFEVSSSEDEELKGEPRIHHFDRPQRTTITPGGEILHEDLVPDSQEVVGGHDHDCDSSDVLQNEKKTAARQVPEDVLDTSKATRNGGWTNRYFWSQQQFSVQTMIWVPLNLKGRDVVLDFGNTPTVLGSYNLTERCSQDLSIGRKVDASTAAIEEVFRGRLAFAVVTNDDRVFWELRTFSRLLDSAEETTPEAAAPRIPPLPCRALILSLRKALPAPNAVLWWNRFLDRDTPVDVENFPDRAPPSRGALEFRANWAKAQEMFRESIRERQGKDHRIAIDDLLPKEKANT